jgi:hypothetical protein
MVEKRKFFKEALEKYYKTSFIKRKEKTFKYINLLM